MIQGAWTGMGENAGGEWLIAQAEALTPGRLIWGSPQWLVPMGVVLLLLALVVAWSYAQRGTSWPTRVAAGVLKLIGMAAVALCVVEPLFSAVRPRPGANLFLLLADNSESMTIRDRASSPTRAEQLQAALQDESPWLARLGQDFELRRYLFDSRLRATESYDALTFDGTSTSLGTSVASLAAQYRGRPVAGVLVLTDGNATDWNEADVAWEELPPVYPVLIGAERPPRDLSISRVSVSQTNFETLPVTVQAFLDCESMDGEDIVLQLLDSDGKELQRQSVRAAADGKPVGHRFQFRPEQPGVSFYEVRAMAAADEARQDQPETVREATLANNSRHVLVDRGQGPYRVLYVTGRPNWDFKFLRRAVEEDNEVQLVGLVRIAKKEPKFDFRGHVGERTNNLFRGFDNQADPTAEQYDEPVLIRLGTRDQAELRDGFPKAAEQLFEFQAVILDNVEVEFFTRDQLSLMQEFVSQRGGSLMMMAGEESFGGGGYARTPIGDMLPVYVDRSQTALPAGEHRLEMAREGWLQSWVRLRPTEQEEEKRLAAMPGFRVWNAATSIKPGATVLLHTTVADEESTRLSQRVQPALVVQKFGAGHTAAMLVGDLWRWGMRREADTSSDLETFWRQTVRWLVSDVPRRVEVECQRGVAGHGPAVVLQVDVRDGNYRPLDNADITCFVTTPDGRRLELTAQPKDDQAGVYLADVVPRLAGAYRVAVTAKAADGSDVGTCETGFTHEPAMEEYQALRPNRELLERIAQRTGGQLLESDEVAGFVADLPNRKLPITEPWIYPLWHQWPMLFLAVICLVGEWGLRRWKGLP